MTHALTFAAAAMAAAVGLSAPAHAAHFTDVERYDFTIDLTAAAAGTTSAASGSGTFSLGVDETTGVAFADYDISFSGMTPVALHFHLGKAGENGPVLYDIHSKATGGFTFPSNYTFAGTWRDGDEAPGQPSISALVGFLGLDTVRGDSGLYVNVHSADFPSGEIRGQVFAAQAGIMAPVPVPAALPMMAAGLAGLGLLARRRAKKG